MYNCIRIISRKYKITIYRKLLICLSSYNFVLIINVIDWSLLNNTLNKIKWTNQSCFSKWIRVKKLKFSFENKLRLSKYFSFLLINKWSIWVKYLYVRSVYLWYQHIFFWGHLPNTLNKYALIISNFNVILNSMLKILSFPFSIFFNKLECSKLNLVLHSYFPPNKFRFRISTSNYILIIPNIHAFIYVYWFGILA